MEKIKKVISQFTIVKYIKAKIKYHKVKRIQQNLIAHPHTLEELERYIKDKYGAVEISSKSNDYKRMRGKLKEALILRYKPELLGKQLNTEELNDNDPESVRRFLLQIKQRVKKAESIPKDIFPFDFHMYEFLYMDKYNIQIYIENSWNELRVTYRTENKIKRKIIKQITQVVKDIYLYYGVTEEDIKQNSYKYQLLVSVLSQ